MKELFRIIDPLFGPNNIYKMPAKKTVSLGPVMIGTVANKNLPWLEVEIINENNCRKNLGAPLDKDGVLSHFDLQSSRRADYIGISASMTNAVPRAKKIIETYRNLPQNLRPKAIIVGGWHAGDSPEEFLEVGADVVLHGEGERSIAELLKALSTKESLENFPGISFIDHGVTKRNAPDFVFLTEEELENLPCPDFGLVRFAKIELFPLSRTRGCSGKCRFCRVRTNPRSISPQKLLEQVETLASQGVHKFFIIDDRSEEDLEGFRQLLKGLIYLQEKKSLYLEFTTQDRLSLAEDLETLALMGKAGIEMVAIGFESPIPEELTAMRKPINPKKMIKWTKAFKKNGLHVHAMMIFGYPLSTCANPKIVESMKNITVKDRAKAFWSFIQKAKPDSLQVLLYTPIIGTEDYAFLKREGRLFKNFDLSLYDGMHLVFRPDKGIDPEELQEESIRLMRKFYCFNWLWRFSRISLILNSLRTAFFWIAMPILWLINFLLRHFFNHSLRQASCLAWQKAKKPFRKASLSLGGNAIIISWLKSFRKMKIVFPKKP